MVIEQHSSFSGNSFTFIGHIFYNLDHSCFSSLDVFQFVHNIFLGMTISEPSNVLDMINGMSILYIHRLHSFSYIPEDMPFFNAQIVGFVNSTSIYDLLPCCTCLYLFLPCLFHNLPWLFLILHPLVYLQFLLTLSYLRS